MSYFVNQLDKKLQKEDFELPIKNLQDEEHEISYLFAKTGVPSLVIDYPTNIALKNWEERSYIQKKYIDIIDIYWNTLFTQKGVSGFIQNQTNTPIQESTITIVELGDIQPTIHSQSNGFFYMPLPNLETVTLRIESEGFIPVEKKIKVKESIQKTNISLVVTDTEK